MRRITLLVLWFAGISGALQAQAVGFMWEVYLLRSAASGLDRLTFIDVLSGDVRTTEVPGVRYTITGDRVTYFDYVSQRVMQVGVDGVPRPHPWMQMDTRARRIDWVVSTDGRYIAWTETFGTPEALTTVTRVATLEGLDQRVVFNDGPREGIRALPVGFTPDDTLLIMDAQPDGIGALAPYTQYAGLFTVNLATGAITPLPGEPACFCAAGFSGDVFVRLTLTNDLQGFDIVVRNLAARTETRIPAQTPLDNVTQAGNVLISPDGTLGVYALSSISNFGTPRQTVRTVFMLVDLRAMTQRRLTEPITTFVEAIRWTDQNNAIIFTSPQLSGTWKIRVEDGRLQQVAAQTFIGTLLRSTA
jgi:hypothetical protein